MLRRAIARVLAIGPVVRSIGRSIDAEMVAIGRSFRCGG
jgi:hypothetical protein